MLVRKLKSEPVSEHTFKCWLSASHCVWSLSACTDWACSHSGWSWYWQHWWAWRRRCHWNRCRTVVQMWKTTRRNDLMQMDVTWCRNHSRLNNNNNNNNRQKRLTTSADQPMTVTRIKYKWYNTQTVHDKHRVCHSARRWLGIGML